MYRDPARIRKHVTKVRFSDEEYRLIEAYCDYNGEQRAVFVRELVLERARAVLMGGESGLFREAVEVPYGARINA